MIHGPFIRNNLFIPNISSGSHQITVRDINGLALSSRNKLLNFKGREIAKAIYSNFKKIRHLNYKYTKDLEIYLKKQFIKITSPKYYSNLMEASSLHTPHPKQKAQKLGSHGFSFCSFQKSNQNLAVEPSGGKGHHTSKMRIKKISD